MALRSTRSDGPRGTDERPRNRRDARLAELVAELASCDPDTALNAVHAGDGPAVADPLELVARAMTDVRHRAPEPQDRLRVAGFLRPEQRRLPRRTTGRAATAVVERPSTDEEPGLVHHGSLRRWERTDAAEAADADDHVLAAAIRDGDVIDLRDRTARFRRPAPGAHERPDGPEGLRG